MRGLTNQQCNEWLSSHRFDYTEAVRSEGVEGFVSLTDAGYSKSFVLPNTTRAHLVIARRLAQWVQGADVLLWITSFTGVTEEMELFDSFRRLCGEGRWLIDAPGHLFLSENEINLWELTAFLFFTIAFEWSGFVLQGNHESILWLDDGWVHTLTQNQRKDEEVQRILSTLKS